MGLRFLIVDQDEVYGRWLCHHVGAGWPDSRTELVDLAEFERRHAALTRRECDVVLLSVPFGDSPEDPRAEGLDWLRRLREQSGFPIVIAIAAGGNELTAVRALRLGAADYLPKTLLTPERLSTSIKICRRLIERRKQPRDAAPAVGDPAPAPPPVAVPHEQAPDPAIADRDLIPRYTILRTLGESEQALVYLAESSELGHNVVLKVSKVAREDDAEQRRLFAREYEAIAAMNHPSVVDLYDYGLQQGREYLVMEYFPCGDLKARLQRPVSPAEALDFVRRIAAALKFVHDSGIIHRDLKPPNVMLRETGDVVLIDFGLARSLTDGRSSTRAGMLRGSPYYMSPEQAQAQPLDARTDLYSLGVIYYELLTNRKPYLGQSAIEVLRQHVHAPVPRLPAELAGQQWLLERLMAKSRDERFASAQAVLDAIAPATV
jgi:CheY-like chemotaxis protein